MDDANAPEPAQVEPSGDYSPTPPIPIDRTEIDRSPRTDRDSLAPGGLEGTPGSEALAAFLRFHPFMAFFIWLSDVQYSGAHPGDLRVAKHREACGRFYWTCVVFDFIVTAVAVVGILILAGVVAYKAVWL